MPRLGEQRLGFRRIGRDLGKLGVFGMHGCDVMVLADGAQAAKDDIQHGPIVGCEPECLAHPLIVERLDVVLHAGDAGLRRVDAVYRHMRQRLDGIELGDVHLVEPIDLLCRHGRDPGCGIAAEVEELDRRERCRLLPMLVTALEDGALAHLELGELVGAGAVRADFEFAVLLGVEHEKGVMEEMLGNCELRRAQVQSDGEVVDRFDGIRRPQLGRLLRLAGGIDAVVLLDQDAGLHQAKHGRARLCVEHPLDVPDDIARPEGTPLAPGDVAAQMQGPRLEVAARLPSVEKHRSRDVVVSRAREIVADLAHDVAGLDA